MCSQAGQTASGRGPSHLVFSRPHFAAPLMARMAFGAGQCPNAGPREAHPLASKQALHQMRQTLDLEPPTPEHKFQWLTSQLCNHNEITLNE